MDLARIIALLLCLLIVLIFNVGAQTSTVELEISVAMSETSLVPFIAPTMTLTTTEATTTTTTVEATAMPMTTMEAATATMSLTTEATATTPMITTEAIPVATPLATTEATTVMPTEAITTTTPLATMEVTATTPMITTEATTAKMEATTKMPTSSTASEFVDKTTMVSSTTDAMQVDITMVLWIVLGCLIALIIITLGAIILVSVAHCRRRMRKKQPTALDIISKWEDTPNESSDIQLLSMKAVEDGEDKDSNGNGGEKKIDDRVEEKEEGKVGSDEKSDKIEVKESKEDDVTVGTFGFAEKPVELASVEAKTESPTGSEKKEGRSEKGEATKEWENEKLVEVTIEKAGEESAVDIGSSGGKPAPNNTSVIGTATTVPTEKEKAQEGTRPEPVPVQIPIIGQQVADVKAPVVEHAADSEVKTSDTEQSNKSASPSKAQEEKSETSPSNQDNVLATESVSKKPEPAATITKPQTEAVSLASDKPPSIASIADDATGGLSLFTNEDMEKALGVAATKDLGQVESTQL